MATLDELAQMAQSGGASTQSTPATGSNLPPADHLNALGANTNTHRDIDVSLGPVRLQGYFDTSSLEIGVEPMVLGMHLGAYYGNLNKDFDIGINIIAAKGNIKLYLKKNALWVNCDIKPFGMNQFTQDLKIFDL